jgi:protein-S-isoprenylcysteine O-methyltransferase Ste14
MTSWKQKIILPVLYFVATLALFYFVGRTQDFALNSVQLIGVVLSIISFVLWIISRVQLADSFSISPTASRLIDRGVYSKIRHPVYVFSFLALLGIFFFLQRWPIFLLLIPLLILQIFRIHKEGQILSKKFGKEYLEYKHRTWF